MPHIIRTRCTFVIVPVLTLALTLTMREPVSGQTPDESQLPMTAPPTVLPDESKLPASEPALRELPGEADLPGITPGADEANKESSLSPGSLRPWLRLRFDGHTGIIRALDQSRDGQYLVSAGEDKDLHIWTRRIAKDQSRTWFHRRTVRWQVERGDSGRIFAAAIQGKYAAIAGHGAMGGLGEIWIIDMTNGNLVRSLVDVNRGHRQVIASLAWQPAPAGNTDGDKGTPADGTTPMDKVPALRLASADVEGRVLLWTPDTATGIWSPRTIVAPDRETYGPAVAEALASRRRFLPLTFLDHYQLLMPRYVGTATEPAGAARWRLQRFNIATNRTDVLAIDHIEMVTAMVASDDGKQLATGDATGRVWWASFANDANAPSLKSVAGPRRVALSLDFSDDAKRLLVGTTAASSDVDSPVVGTLEWFNVSDATLGLQSLSTVNVPSHAWGCEFDTLTSQAITVSNNRIQTYSITDDKFEATPAQTLAPPVGPVRSVAFAETSPPYQIVMRSEVAGVAAQASPQVFDLSAIRLQPDAPREANKPAAGTTQPAIDANGEKADASESKWIDPQATRGAWELKLEVDNEGPRHFLYEADVKRGRMPLRGELHGLVTSAAWFEEKADAVAENSKPRSAVVVGTDGRNNLYVFERGQTPEARLLRQYRGHTGTVLSVGVSDDLRYLVSGSDDATVCIWKLEDVFSADELTNRWGAMFEVRGNRLFAINVRRDGPLYFRGVRDGDQLMSLSWMDGLEARASADANGMLTALTQTTFDTLVVFQFSRLGRPREAFQSFPAWQPMATLFVDRTREWAIWTPAGFYDSSFGGNELFGWQINRGVSALPEYFRAAQFRQRLEKPEAMRKLFEAGDLATAMERGLSGMAPPPGEGAIVNQFLTKPSIRMIRPSGDMRVTSGSLDVEAEIRVPRGSRLEPPKAFAGGVPAVNRTLVLRKEEGDKDLYLYRWTARLPSDSRVPLEVVAATDAGTSDRVSVELDNQSVPTGRPPRMYFLALGVSEYSDPQIQKLDFAARGAGVMADLFRRRTSGLYQTTTSELLDRDAIRPLWREYAAEAARELSRDVGPNDLVVMYLCGHGVRDRRTNQWYFVTADARYNDLMNDRYDDLLSFDDLAMLGELPCRKLAIIDSCHSGAVQPVMRSDDLKAAMRMLQGDVVLTMTASEGEEEAAEQKDRQLGRFTSHLFDAFSGAADTNRDGVVTLNETVQHAVKAAAEDARVTGFVQHPTAGPADLLKTLELPLTRYTTINE